MAIDKVDIIGEMRPFMVMLNNGQALWGVGNSVGRLAYKVQQLLPEGVTVIGMFDGTTMYEIDWEIADEG